MYKKLFFTVMLIPHESTDLLLEEVTFSQALYKNTFRLLKHQQIRNIPN